MKHHLTWLDVPSLRSETASVAYRRLNRDSVEWQLAVGAPRRSAHSLRSSKG